MKKLAQYPRLLFLFIFGLTYAVAYFCGVDNPMLRTVFSITIAFVLSPRKKKIMTQTGEKIQITWIFLKESITID